MKKGGDSSVRNALILEKLPGCFLILCLTAVFGLLIWVIRPFLTVIFIAAVLTIAFYPVYRRILKFFRGWERTASLVTCLLVILLIVVPLTVFIIMLAGEATNTYHLIQDKMDSGVFDKYIEWLNNVFENLKERLESVVDIERLDVKKEIVNLAQNLSSFLVSQVTVFVKGISNLVFKFLVMLFAMFYFFKDGVRIVERIGKMSPLPSMHEQQLFAKMGSMVNAIVVGVFLTAVIQGIVGGIGFAIAGISSPVFWGAAIALFSLVPLVGTAVIWVPAAIILAVMGFYGTAIFIFLWGMLIIGLVDNVVRPYLIGGKAHTYPLMTFFVILGGIWTMGIQGIIFGPIVLMLFLSFLHIYESEYGKVLKKEHEEE